MGRIVVSENVSLDGVVEDPTGGEGFRHGGWFERSVGQDREAWAEFFGARWSSRTGEWADRLNGMPKYVVASSVVDPPWGNSTVLEGDVAGAVSELKRQIDGELVVYASRRLVRTLLAHDLVDELRLIVFPVVLGSGERLFGETDHALRLRGSRTVGDGLAQLRYEVVRGG